MGQNLLGGEREGNLGNYGSLISKLLWHQESCFMDPALQGPGSGGEQSRIPGISWCCFGARCLRHQLLRSPFLTSKRNQPNIGEANLPQKR